MFRDRVDAGRRLGAQLADRSWRSPVVLAIPRGAVPVGAEVAHLLGASLDVFVVCKIGSPGQPELGMGAVAEDGTVLRTERVVRALRVTDEQFERGRLGAAAEVARRVERYRRGRTLPGFGDRDVVVVDDGLATGVTVETAVHALRPVVGGRLVVAAPVGAPDTTRRLAEVADDVVCVNEPRHFSAVGEFYRRFDQTSDAEVLELLDRTSSPERSARSRPG